MASGMPKRPTWFFLPVMALVALAACSRLEHAPSASEAPGRAQSDTAQAALTDRQLVRTVMLSLAVSQIETARARVVAITEAAGGFVEALDTASYEGERRLSVKLRLPKAKLDALLVQLRALGEVTHENQSVEDVTRVYVDTDARLRNLDRTEQRLLELLGKPGAPLGDVIAVEKELSRVREEVERMTAEMRSLKERVALSAVQLELEEEVDLASGPSVWTPWRRLWRDASGMFGGSVRALVATAAALVSAAIYALPWIPVAVGLWYGLRRLRARRR